MITDWDELDGKTITGTYHGHGGVVVLLGDEFVVITTEMDYHNESAYPVLAPLDDEDALYTASAAKAIGAHDLLKDTQNRRAAKVQEQELQRLEYLQEKYARHWEDKRGQDHRTAEA